MKSTHRQYLGKTSSIILIIFYCGSAAWSPCSADSSSNSSNDSSAYPSTNEDESNLVVIDQKWLICPACVGPCDYAEGFLKAFQERKKM